MPPATPYRDPTVSSALRDGRDRRPPTLPPVDSLPRTARPGGRQHEPGRRHEVVLPTGIVPYRTYGDDAAPAVVMLHGLRGDHHGLEPIVSHLSGLRVIVPDLPGFGETAPLLGRRHDVDGYAAWARAFVEAVAPGAALLGHSFGSIVAAHAVAAGLAVPRLVLVTPIAGSALAGPRQVMTRATVLVHRLAAALPERVGAGLLRSRPFTRIASVAMVKTPDRALRRWIHAEHDRWFGGFADRATLLEAFTASVSHGVDEVAGAITAPTLVVATDLDDITTVAEQRRLTALFPDARIEVVTGTGHLVHYERPDAVADLVGAFLR